MSFSQFEHSAKGAAIAPVLVSSAALGRMEAFSRAGHPALLAVAGEIEKVAPGLSDTEKQHVGRWVHRLLGPRGWRPIEKKRLPKGGLFTTAAVYGRIGPAEREPGRGRLGDDRDGPLLSALGVKPSADERLALARTRVAALPIRPASVASFIADKRRDAHRDK